MALWCVARAGEGARTPERAIASFQTPRNHWLQRIIAPSIPVDLLHARNTQRCTYVHTIKCVLPLAFSSTFTDSFFPTRVAFLFVFLSFRCIGRYVLERTGGATRPHPRMLGLALHTYKRKSRKKPYATSALYFAVGTCVREYLAMPTRSALALVSGHHTRSSMLGRGLLLYCFFIYWNVFSF